MNHALLIFSGHNMRAVITLCRAMMRLQVPFHLVASSPEDPIFRTTWAPHVIFTRRDRSVTLALFEAIAAAVPAGSTLVYCPTTEFINHFVLQQREALEARGLQLALPDATLYETLSNKSSSPPLIEALTGISAPPELAWDAATAPCVIKPRENIAGHEAHYPLICLDDATFQQARMATNPEHWFAQRHVRGQSHYLCGHIGRDGTHIAFWQTNMLQQPGGKSIVLARTGSNPGVDASALFRGLADIGYFGPLMLEFIQDAEGRLYYIETNPRFWGPLQLAEDVCPQLLAHYAHMLGLAPASQQGASATPPGWYAWHAGALTPGCHAYPAAAGLAADEIATMLQKYDVYARPDTSALSGIL